MRTERIQCRINKVGCTNTMGILILLFLLLFSPTFAAGTIISPLPAAAAFVTGAYVAWETDTASNSRVDYGKTTAYGANVTDGSSVTHHVLRITGLTANTTYHYKVTSGATVSADRTSS